jgi:hypothetical protein
MYGTLSPDVKPADLGTTDVGFLFESTDFYHLYKWTGSVWTWGPGDGCNGGQKCDFAKAPTPASAWKKLNGLGDDNTNPVGAGNPIKYAKEDGTIGSITRLDDMTAGTYSKSNAAFTGVRTSATAPTIAATTASGNASIQSGNAAIGVDNGAGTTFNAAATGTATTVAAHTHNHTDSGHAHADSGHTHGITATTSLAGGDPVDYMNFLPYLRR